ncbi:hypothetical protein MG290_03105 [Flavobacterium sp. CBA20B-1]|uniref:SecDF P1 head subdomain-containing protein n=1 Tax=unclassified Flavobacterium TaxID=196869 RepID=UPI002224C40D|nr:MULTISPECIES: hypothetical protein [unclassified Flavobacterium]WCM42681.1 hypothetical protein MG290_03105 [Flavobacterium sp. CBA20B-1]
MKNLLFTLTTIFLLTAIATKAQEQQYFEFGWQNKYGIVDTDGQEIVAPIYDWKNYTLHYQSPYIALNSKNNGAIIINTQTGKKENFNYLAGSYLVDMDRKEYLFAYNDSTAFLMDNKDLEIRKNLPKKYIDIWQSGDYIIGNTAANDDGNTVDILSKKDLKIKLATQKIKNTNYYKTTNGQKIYAFIQQNLTVFYDEELNQIAAASKEIKDFEEVQTYLLSNSKIAIIEEPYPITEAMIGPPPKYPHINTRNETLEDGYVNFYIFQSKNDYVPFFKFKWNRSPQNKLIADRYVNKIEARSKKEHINETLFLFYTDVIREKIFFPKKYWKEIGLEQLYNTRKVDFDPDELVVKKANKDPYVFEPFTVEREDGIYVVLKSNNEYMYKDVVLAKNPVVSKADIEAAKAEIGEYIHRPIINVKLTEAGALKFAEASEKNVGKPLAIVINKKVISMPIVQSKIDGGKVQISGDFSMEEANKLAEKLKKMETINEE